MGIIRPAPPACSLARQDSCESTALTVSTMSESHSIQSEADRLRVENARLAARVAELESLVTSLSAGADGEVFSVETFGTRSPLWPTVRDSFIKENPACAACGGVDALAVHHVEPFHLRPDLELDPDNLLTLCSLPSRLCHFLIGHSGDWKSFNPHVVTDAARMLRRRKERRYG